MPAIVGMPEGEYRRSCLSGFGRAEECGVPVGERVLRVLRAELGGRGQAQGGQGEETEMVLRWLERELEVARAERAQEGVEAEGH